MNQLFEWVSMGGYSMYVWPAYGLVCAVLLINIVSIKWQKARTQKKLNQWFKSQYK
jgi:heme exporter protein D